MELVGSGYGGYKKIDTKRAIRKKMSETEPGHSAVME